MAVDSGKTIIEPGAELSEEAKARQKEAKTRKKKDAPVVLTIEDQPKRKVDTDGKAIEAPKTKKKVSYYQKRKQREKESAEGAATVLILLLDSMVGTTFGEECRMNEHEKSMILEPLIRILGRLDYATTQAVEKWTDPILLAMGLAAWMGRVYRIQSEKGDDDDEGRDDEFITPLKPSDDGKEEPVEKLPRPDDFVAAFDNQQVVDILGAERIDMP